MIVECNRLFFDNLDVYCEKPLSKLTVLGIAYACNQFAHFHYEPANLVFLASAGLPQMNEVDPKIKTNLMPGPTCQRSYAAPASTLAVLIGGGYCPGLMRPITVVFHNVFAQPQQQLAHGGQAVRYRLTGLTLRQSLSTKMLSSEKSQVTPSLR